MYEELIEALEGCVDCSACTECPIHGLCNGTFDCAAHIAADHIKAQAAAIVSQTDQLAAKDAEIARLTAERDAAVKENRFRRGITLTPLYTCGGHGYGDDDDEDFWCPICRQRLGTHRGFKTTCPRCGQQINCDGEPCWEYDELSRTEWDNPPKKWRTPAKQDEEG